MKKLPTDIIGNISKTLNDTNLKLGMRIDSIDITLLSKAIYTEFKGVLEASTAGEPCEEIEYPSPS